MPPAPGMQGLPPEVADELRLAWAAWWEPFSERVRQAPAAFGSDDERLAIAALTRGLVGITERFGRDLAPLILRQSFSRIFEEIIREEERHTPTIRRFGLKLLEHAVSVLGELFEAAAAFAPPNLPTEGAGQLLPETDQDLAHLLDAPSVAVLRLQMCAFVALELVPEAERLDEFVAWARRAREAAQAAAPYVALLAAQRRPPRLTEPSPEVVLTAAEFGRLGEVLERPPAPSARLRRALGGSS